MLNVFVVTLVLSLTGVQEAPKAAVAARADDVKSIDAIVAAVYDVISGAVLERDGFFEREIARRMETFGNIAHVFSTYESKHAAGDPAPFARGINSIQLLKDGGRWWIVTIYWDSEKAGNPIPSEYLLKK